MAAKLWLTMPSGSWEIRVSYDDDLSSALIDLRALTHAYAAQKCQTLGFRAEAAHLRDMPPDIRTASTYRLTIMPTPSHTPNGKAEQ